ncbi:MAG: hypothetical protein ACLSUM_04125 [Dysosmobacter welbionis]
MASPALAEAVKREEEALAGAGRVLVRPSGTEALIRVMVEAKHADRPGGGGPAGRFHQIAKKIKICFSDFFTNCLTFHWIDRYNTICTNLARRHPSPWTSAAMKRCANWLPAAAAKRRKLL